MAAMDSSIIIYILVIGRYLPYVNNVPIFESIIIIGTAIPIDSLFSQQYLCMKFIFTYSYKLGTYWILWILNKNKAKSSFHSFTLDEHDLLLKVHSSDLDSFDNLQNQVGLPIWNSLSSFSECGTRWKLMAFGNISLFIY